MQIVTGDDETAARRAAVTATNVIISLCFGLLAYYRENAQRRTFYSNLVAAATKMEFLRLRNISSQLITAQLPTFARARQDENPRAFQAMCTVVFLTVQTADRLSEHGQPDSAGSGSTPKSDDVAAAGDMLSADRVQSRAVANTRLLNSIFSAFDAAAAEFGVDKIRTQSKMWVGAYGLSQHVNKGSLSQTQPTTAVTSSTGDEKGRGDEAAGGAAGAGAATAPADGAGEAVPTAQITLGAQQAVRFAAACMDKVAALSQSRSEACAIACSAGVATERTVAGLLGADLYEYQVSPNRRKTCARFMFCINTGVRRSGYRGTPSFNSHS